MQNLKIARKNKGMTQQEVAGHIGVDRTTYSNYETGKRDPDTENLLKLALLFEVSTDYLLGNSDNPAPAGQKEKPPVETEGDIEAMVESILSELTGADGDTLMLDGKPTSAKALEYLRESIRANIEHAKRMNEQKNG